MKPMRLVIAVLCLFPTLIAGQSQTYTARARTVQYRDTDVVQVKTKLRFTTVIELPKNEEILDFVCGDKESWVVNGAQNVAYVKPAKAGIETNLVLVTASGNTYLFLLAEVSALNGGDLDLKILVEKIGSGQSIDDYRRQLELAKEETRQAKAATQAAIDLGFSQFVSKLRFTYRFNSDEKRFGVLAMYTDGKFTYIHARPQEVPVLYEIKDGKPSFVGFRYASGVYVVEKVLDEGYLSIGKVKLNFRREQ